MSSKRRRVRAGSRSRCRPQSVGIGCLGTGLPAGQTLTTSSQDGTRILPTRERRRSSRSWIAGKLRLVQSGSLTRAGEGDVERVAAGFFRFRSGGAAMCGEWTPSGGGEPPTSSGSPSVSRNRSSKFSYAKSCTIATNFASPKAALRLASCLSVTALDLSVRSCANASASRSAAGSPDQSPDKAWIAPSSTPIRRRSDSAAAPT